MSSPKGFKNLARLKDEELPPVAMHRVIFHWTAGSYTPSALDKEHYHFVIDGKGHLHAGLHSIADNVPPLSEDSYAAHTRATNSYSIGISLCAMAGARDTKRLGRYPIKPEQWESAKRLVATLCSFYAIPVTDKTVLSHAEVQDNLGIWQRGKWDISVLKFEPGHVGAKAVGDLMRAGVAELLK